MESCSSRVPQETSVKDWNRCVWTAINVWTFPSLGVFLPAFPPVLPLIFPSHWAPSSWKSLTLPLSYSFLEHSTFLSLLRRTALQFHLVLSISSESCGAALLCCEIQLGTAVLLLLCSQISSVAGAELQGNRIETWEPGSSSRSRVTALACAGSRQVWHSRMKALHSAERQQWYA